MKKSLFLYLFIIATLTNLFTFMYFSRQADFDKSQCQKTEKRLRDSVAVAVNQLSDANYFSLEYNQNAQDYFVSNLSEAPIDYTKLIPAVTSSLMAFNDRPEGNPYTGQEKLDEKKFIINKAKVLNHRWIIADFSNGEFWGEVLLKYFVNPDGSFDFEVIQSLIYRK